MARPKKLTLDFFIHDKDARCDRKIRALRRKHGNDGYATYFCLLEMICDEDGLSLNIASTLELETAVEDCGLRDSAHFFKVLHTCVELGLFDKQLWESERIIFSHALHRRYVARLEDRKAAAIRQKRSREAKALQSKLSEVESRVVTCDNPVTTPLSQNCHSTDIRYQNTELQNSDTKAQISELEDQESSSIDHGDAPSGVACLDDEDLVADATDDREAVEPFQFEQPRWTVPPNSQTAEQPNGQNPLPVQPECSKPPENKQSKGRGKNSAAAENPLFAEFWKVFPRKVGKPQAEKAFAKVPADIAHQLPAIVEQQKAEYRAQHPGTTDWRYFPHPTTYLNQQRWESQEEAIAPTATEFSPDFLHFLASSWIPSLPGYNGASQNIHQAKDWCIRAGSQRVEVAHEAWRDRCQREAALSQPAPLNDIQPASLETRQAVAASLRSLLGEKRHAV